MRWEQLFADLDAQFDVLAEQEAMSELADRQRMAVGTVTLVQRCLGALGHEIRVRTRAGSVMTGRLADVGPDWVLLERPGSIDVVVPLGAVASIEGLTAASGTALSGVAQRFDLRLVLRGLARDRAPVQIQLPGPEHASAQEVSGTIDRVGADFVEVAQHPAWEVRRSTAIRSVVVVPLAAIVCVTSQSMG